jgi:hypothetical protein
VVFVGYKVPTRRDFVIYSNYVWRKYARNLLLLLQLLID